MTDDQTPAAKEIVAGLLRPAAAISPKYFYDVRGSELFEAITELPEYYPTRTEREIMATHADAIAARIGAGGTVIELGAGNCEKARDLCRLLRPARFVAVDISAEFLQEAVAGLRTTFPGLDARAVAADLTAGIVLPADLPRERRLVFYPGSSIGNFDPSQAFDLLARIRQLLDEDGALLIGVDLEKDVAVLETAYDDAVGVTAAFNLNVLNHVNRLLGSDFDSGQWRHRAFYNAEESRIEMHLEAAVEVRVAWPGGDRVFARGERIHTENSYKYRTGTFIELLSRAGFRHAEAWTDERRWFAVILARP
ncbi:histidine-specific methyltransferase EgtD [mine drainage metagenome]|uniref:Histidine-specific methyltransferase EgtD n=1 Tax=mine drainage metagenome TaxID=410659 RepID=A0A1J5RQ31_9ZZZZ